MTKNFIKRLPKNQYIGGNCLKRGGGGLGQFPDLRGVWQKRRGGDTLMHTMVPLQQNRQRIS